MNKIKTSVLGFVASITILAPLLATVAVITNPSPSRVAASSATPPTCQYVYSNDGSSIERTVCGTDSNSIGGWSDATYVQSSAQNASLQFTYKDGNCTQKITVNDINNAGAGTLTGTIPASELLTGNLGTGSTTSSGGTCLTLSSTNVTIGNTSAVLPTSSNDVINTYLGSLINKACAAELTVGGAVGQNCTAQYQSWVTTCTQNALNAVDPTSKTVNQDFKDNFSACLSQKSGGKLTKAQIASALPADAYQQAVAADERGGAAANGSVSCESQSGALGWLLCALIDGLQKAVGGIYDHVVQPLLRTQPLDKNSAQGQNIYKAWSNFRIYGDIFLVIALLVIVFGESIGGGVIDAYTAKKVLPRLLAAAILINLSFYICAVMVDIINVVGNGISTLITAPFALTGNFKIDIGGGGATTLTALIGVAVTKSLLVAGADGFFAWLWAVVLLPAILIFVAIMVVVLLRSALIVFLVIISPVAFALYCLPNTEKYFRQWWDTLFRTLLVYPIIAVLFALGNVGGYLVSQVSGSGLITGGIGAMLAVVALIIPLILIPFSFRVAGGILGRMHDAVSGLRTRAHSMGEERRQHAKDRLGRSKQERKAWALNQAINRNPVGQGIQRIPFLGKHVGGLATGAQQKLSIMNAQLLRDARFAPGANDEWWQKAQMHGSYAKAMRYLPGEIMAANPDMSEAEAKQMARDAAMRAQGSGLGWSQSAGMTAFQLGVQDGTVFKDQKEQQHYINMLTGKDEALQDRVWGFAYAYNKQAGRSDLSPSFGTGKALLDKLRRGETVSDIEYKKATVEAALSASNNDIARMKGKGIDDINVAFADVLKHADTTETEKAAIVAKRENMVANGIYMPEIILEKVKTGTPKQPKTTEEVRIEEDRAERERTITAEVHNDVRAAQRSIQGIQVQVQTARNNATALQSELDRAIGYARDYPDNPGYAQAVEQLRTEVRRARTAVEDAERQAEASINNVSANAPEHVQKYENVRQSGRFDPQGPGGPLAPGGQPTHPAPGADDGDH